jgi:protocatechuate 3,4-dioxygenase beta subunit
METILQPPGPMKRKRISRREVLGTMGAAGAALAFGCGGSPTQPSTSTSAGTTTTGSTAAASTSPASATVPASTNTACVTTPTETIGPYPSLTDLFRSDVREGKPGTLLTLTVEVVNVASSCAVVPNANVEIWHCDVAGNYSEYGSQRAETYLRGIQTTNGNGEVTFTTIYPGWYQGRATHIHLEVLVGGVSRKATQIAFPESINNAVHRNGVYASRGTNPTSNLADGIFADSLSAELVTPTGDVSNGFTAYCQVGINV